MNNTLLTRNIASKLFSLLGILFLSINSYASHTNGGEITVEHDTLRRYKVTFTNFLNCHGNDNAQITISCNGSSNGVSIRQEPILFSQLDTVDYDCNSLCQLKTQTTTYLVDLHLSKFSSFQNCDTLIFRAVFGALTSMTNTVANGYINSFTLETILYNQSVITNNSTPKFYVPPVLKYCCNMKVTQSLGAADKDGDSLSYELTTLRSTLPMGTVMPEVYSNGYSPTYPVTGYNPPGLPHPFAQPNNDPPMGVSYNATNGELIYTPTDCTERPFIQMTAYEWRKDTSGIYRKTSSTSRAFIAQTLNCPGNNLPSIDIQSSYSLCTGDTFNQLVSTGDVNGIPPPGNSWLPDSVNLKFYNGLGDGASFSLLTDTARLPVGKVEWVPPTDVSLERPHYFTLWAEDDFCPNGISIKTIEINVLDEVKITAKSERLSCNTIHSTTQSNFACLSGTPIHSWQITSSYGDAWPHIKIIGGDTASSFFTWTTQKSGSYYIHYNLYTQDSSFFYQKTDTIHMVNLPTLEIETNSNTVCPLDSFYLNAKTTNTSGLVNYVWMKGDKIISSKENDSLYTSTYSPTLYQVQLRDATNCISEDSILIDVCDNTIPLADTVTICSLDTYTPTIPSSIIQYQWNNTSSNNPLRAIGGGYQIITYQDTAGCTYSDSTLLSVLHKPDQNWTDTTALCSSENQILSSIAADKYEWSTGDSTRTIKAVTGPVSIKATASNGCTAEDSTFIVLADHPIIGIPSVIDTCADELRLTVLEGDLYLWSTGSKSKQLTLNTSGQYWVQAISNGGCTTKDSFTLTLNANKVAPQILLSNNIITSSKSGAHFWYRDGILVAGESGRSIDITNMNGTYRAIHLDQNGCLSDSSNAVNLILGIGGAAINTIKLYPNPTKSGVTIDASELGAIKSIKLLDTHGKLVEHTEYKNGPLIQINWTVRSALLYVVIETDKEVYRGQIAVVR